MFYRVAPIAFVGGSLVPHGGQNLLEPGQLDCAILHGPAMSNFAPIATAMAHAGGATTVTDAASLADEMDALLSDKAKRQTQAGAAAAVAAGEAGVLDRIMAALAPNLASLKDGTPADDPVPTKADSHARA